MKKYLLMPAFVLFMTGASSTKVQHKAEIRAEVAPVSVPMNVKVDSINVRAQELDRLMKQL